MKIGFTKIKKKYIVLALLITWFNWKFIPPQEIVPLMEASDKIKQEYEAAVKQAMLSGQKEIFLKDIITTIKWNKIYVFGGYSNPVESLRYETGVKYPILEWFGDNDEDEGTVAFLNNDELVAFCKSNSGIYHCGQFISNCKKCNEGKLVFHKPIKYIIIKSLNKECNANATRNCDKIDYKKSFEQRTDCDLSDFNENNFSCQATYIGE